jgi:hypothetical protein
MAPNRIVHRKARANVWVDDAIDSWSGRLWCNIVSDDLDALHFMARRIA